MSKPLHRLSGSLLILGMLATGCRQEAGIEKYSIPKERSAGVALPDNHPPTGGIAGGMPVMPSSGPQRMLAAIVRRGESAWFFKLMGSDALVAEVKQTFRGLVESVNFPGGSATPEWKLPETWRQLPASGMRYATLEVATPEGPLELTVTPLRATEGAFEDYVLENVDRWRAQLGLPPTTKANLFDPEQRSGELSEVALIDGEKAFLVDLASGPGSNVASGLADSSSHPPMGGSAALAGGQGSAAAGADFDFQKPDTWTQGKAGGMRKAAFDVKDGPKSAEMTVITLAGAAGDLLANVNRWREQIKLGPLSASELGAELTDINVDDVKAKRVEMVGQADGAAGEGILGVICTQGGQSWFFKMKGDAALIERERDNFDAFVRSVKFAGSEGAEDGK